MGKAKRSLRKKVKPTPLKAAVNDVSDNEEVEPMEADVKPSRAESIISRFGGGASSRGGRSYVSCKIDLKELTSAFVEDAQDDARSAITSKSLRGLNLKKKDKRKLKSDVFTKKLQKIQKNEKEQKEKKKRQKTAIVGDLKELEDTLPTVEYLMNKSDSYRTYSSASNTKPERATSSASNTKGQPYERKVRGIEKESFIKKQMMEDVAIFQAVLRDPTYKANPLSTIVEHLGNKMAAENEKLKSVNKKKNKK